MARNLYKDVGRNKLFRGSSAIIKAFQELPKTDHNLDSLKVVGGVVAAGRGWWWW